MSSSVSKSIIAGVIALILLLAVGGFIINLYISKERERDLQQWESRLGLVADTRVDAIERWVSDQFASLQELADNAALQLYVWQLSNQAMAHGDDNAVQRQVEPVQQTYLRNLILATANRHGFVGQSGSRIPANLPQIQATGLALLNAKLAPVASTPGMPELGKAYLRAAQAALDTGKPASSELRLDSQERAMLAFAMPVKAVLGAANRDGDRATGVLLGIRSAEHELFPLLKQGASFAEQNEALLVQQQDNNVIYLSPTADGGKPLRRTLPLDRKRLASASALAKPGYFGVENNYQGQTVLSVGRSIPHSPWILVQQVSAPQALRESNQRLRFLLTTLSLLLLSVGVFSIAAWRHGSSVRAQHQAQELRDKASKLQEQTELLHAITDNIDTHTLLLSNEEKVLFANQHVADVAEVDSSELIGKSLTAVLGSAAVGELAADIAHTKASREASTRMLELQYGEHKGTYHASVLPIDRVGEHAHPLLVVLNDITDLQSIQARHTRLLNSLVTTLAHLVDLHDPYSAHHSARTEEVCAALAHELDLNSAARQTLHLAATLSNLGKIMIPKDVLMKTDALTDAERELLQKHVQYGIELLENLEFEGPVLATIAQKQEHIDASGYPNGLRGNEMSQTGKILSVANAFVALVSPRAYREGVSVREAVGQLMQTDTNKYDRHVTAALLHVTENRKDWSDWSV
ncbi:MAG: HD-GYP domain-containing protein [Pseudomonadales bacterium]